MIEEVAGTLHVGNSHYGGNLAEGGVYDGSSLSLNGNDCLYRMKGVAKWIMPYVDTDEWLASHERLQGNKLFSLPHVLDKFDDDDPTTAALCFKRQDFCGMTSGCAADVRCRWSEWSSALQKCIVKTGSVNAITVHYPSSYKGSVHTV